MENQSARKSPTHSRGLGALLVDWLRAGGWRWGAAQPTKAPRLAVVERIPLAARHQLALVEADGERVLVALTPEGTPVFYPLAGHRRAAAAAKTARRVSC